MDLSILKNVNADFLLSLEPEDLSEFLSDSSAVLDYVKYNKSEFFQPYGYQKEFCNLTNHKHHIYLSAGNRVGKTAIVSQLMSYHTTGNYPDWYDGKRIEGSGRVYWAVGYNISMCREILQKAIIGTDNIRIKEDVGSGSIPRDNIVVDSMITDGPRVITVTIKHKDGGNNTLTFFGATDPDVLMGREVSFCVVDEEPLNSERIHNQLEARVSNAIKVGVDGQIVYSASPEQGSTALYEKFANDKSGLLGFMRVTWYDVPERFTPAYIERKKKTFSEHEIGLRINGFPSSGRGLVFNYEFDAITYDPDHLMIQSDFYTLWGSDWGDVNDPTVLVQALYDEQSGIYYVHDLLYFGEAGEARDAEAVAKVLVNHPCRGAPIIVPHDESAKGKSPETQGKMLQRLGFDVPGQTFRNPIDNQLNVERYGLAKAERYNDIERGIIEMKYLLNTGKLKINKHLWQLFKELRSYSYTFNEVTRAIGFSDRNNHCIDSARYAVLSLMAMRGCRYWQASNMHNHTPEVYQTVTFTM